MAYYYTLDNDRYFLRWSVGAAFSGCSVLPDSVVVPEPLRTCACNVRAYRYAGGVITYDPDREGVTDDDGASGVAGKDGISCTHSWNGTVLTVTSASGTSSADLKGEKGEKGDTGAQGAQGEKGDTGAQGARGEKGDTGAQGEQGEKGDTGAQGAQGEKGEKGDKGDTGEKGADGTPCTHSWDGTKLTVTSASGTSSVDLADALVQPDFAQNDETQKDHVKNRTHWAEQALNDVATNSRSLSFSAITPRPTFNFFFAADAGRSFLVTWNGVDYELVSAAGNDGDIYLGDYSLVNSANPAADYPFCLVWKSGSNKVTAYNAAYNGTSLKATVYVEQIGGLIYHKLDEEYLPNADCFASVEGGGTALILVSPNGTRFAITIDNAGALWVSGVIE